MTESGRTLDALLAGGTLRAVRGAGADLRREEAAERERRVEVYARRVALGLSPFDGRPARLDARPLADLVRGGIL